MKSITFKERIITKINWTNLPVKGQMFVAIVHINNDKVGFVYNKKKTAWELPGGHVNSGDSSLLEAAVREYKEEVGISPPKNIKYYFTVKNVSSKKQSQYSFCHFFVCRSKTGNKRMNNIRFFPSIPKNTLFSKKIYQKIIDEVYSIIPIYFKKDLLTWELLSQQYAIKNHFSDKEIHFGPCIPGDSRLRLIKNIRGKKVLDLGCGLGHNSIVLSCKGAKVYAIDFSKKQIEQASDLAEDHKQKIKFYRRNFDTGLDKVGKNFSLVLSVFSLQLSEDIRKIFSDIHKILAEKGMFLFSLPNSAGIMPRSQGVRIIRKNWENNLYMQTRYYSDEYLISALEASGFTNIQIFKPGHDVGDLTLPYYNDYYIKKLGRRKNPYSIIISAIKR